MLQPCTIIFLNSDIFSTNIDISFWPLPSFQDHAHRSHITKLKRRLWFPSKWSTHLSHLKIHILQKRMVCNAYQTDLRLE